MMGDGAPRLLDGPDGRLPRGFHDQIDMGEVGRIAVHAQGRVKSFESHATQIMQLVTGPRNPEGRSSLYTYMDIMVRPDGYRDADIIFVKNKNIRAQIIRALDRTLNDQVRDASGQMGEVGGDGALSGSEIDAAIDRFEERMNRFLSVGLISRPLLVDDLNVHRLLSQLRQDIIRTSSDVDELDTALHVMEPRFLRSSLRIVPPPGGGYEDPWLTVEEFAGQEERIREAGLDLELRDDIVDAWRRLLLAWRDQDAGTVESAAADLNTLLPQVNTEIYPEANRLAWESWYFRANNMTWVWVIYLLSIVFLMMAVIYRWNTAAWLGFGTFMIAFGLHTFAVLLRWYVAERFPNSNMFEAVTTAAWFGGCGALLLEAWVRRTSLRNLFFLGSAVSSMVAMMAAYYMPLHLNANISNMMPVLHDVWLYIHTNVIIFSYVLIFMAAVSSLLYLGWRMLGGGPDYAKIGGAAGVIQTTADGKTYFERAKTTAGQVFDGATMVLVELAFILLWAGTVMGAIWADHSWGRPWGWDPKEVFALNTFIVFIVLLHVRLKAADKGLWTAVLAIIGAIVMVFNWTVINFVISGLHSYA